MKRTLERERGTLFVLLAVFLIMLCGMKVHAGNDDQFDVDATATVTNGGNTANVVVSVTNNGENFGGYVRLVVSDKRNYSESEAAYDWYISVAEDETESVTISFPVMESMALEDANFELQILNEKKQVEQYKKLYHVFDADADIHIGALSDDPTALLYFEQSSAMSSYYYGNTSAPSWEVDELMPADLTDDTTLPSLSMIVIDDFDVSSLKQEELTAIESWVRAGGVLMIGTGENGDKSFDAFAPDFMDAALASPSSYEEYSYFSKNGYITFSDIRYGSSYVTSMGRDAEMRQVGRGWIVLTQFSLTDPELDQPYFMSEMEGTLGNFFDTSRMKKSYVLSDYELERIFGVMQGRAGLNGKLLAAISVIYVFLVGPVLYLVLKKYDKREKYWYAVPIMSLVFVLIIFLASRGFSIRNRVFETIRVVSSDGQRNEADYIFGFSSSQKAWSVSLDPNTTTAGPITLDRGGAFKEGQFRCLTSRSPKGVQMQYRPKGVFECAYLKAMRPAPETEGMLDFDVELKRSGISGSIDNDTGYDFEYVLVVCDGYYQIIPDVENGEHYVLSGYHRESYGNEGNLAVLARDMYNKEDYRSAKLYSALTMAAHELQGEPVFVIGVTSNKERVLQGIGNSEESFLCIYQTSM